MIRYANTNTLMSVNACTLMHLPSNDNVTCFVTVEGILDAQAQKKTCLWFHPNQ